MLDDDEYQRFQWGNCVQNGQHMGRALLRNADGSCIYLGDSGCQIHDHAPRACRQFDCRDLFASKSRPERKQMIKRRSFYKAILDRGRELIERDG